MKPTTKRQAIEHKHFYRKMLTIKRQLDGKSLFDWMKMSGADLQENLRLQKIVNEFIKLIDSKS